MQYCALIITCNSYFLYGELAVKFYFEVITRSCLQLVNTLIVTPFLVNFASFQQNKEEGRLLMDKRKLNGTVNESSTDKQVWKFKATVYIP